MMPGRGRLIGLLLLALFSISQAAGIARESSSGAPSTPFDEQLPEPYASYLRMDLADANEVLKKAGRFGGTESVAAEMSTAIQNSEKHAHPDDFDDDGLPKPEAIVYSAALGAAADLSRKVIPLEHPVPQEIHADTQYYFGLEPRVVISLPSNLKIMTAAMKEAARNGADVSNHYAYQTFKRDGAHALARVPVVPEDYTTQPAVAALNDAKNIRQIVERAFQEAEKHLPPKPAPMTTPFNVPLAALTNQPRPDKPQKTPAKPIFAPLPKFAVGVTSAQHTALDHPPGSLITDPSIDIPILLLEVDTKRFGDTPTPKSDSLAAAVHEHSENLSIPSQGLFEYIADKAWSGLKSLGSSISNFFQSAASSIKGAFHHLEKPATPEGTTPSPAAHSEPIGFVSEHAVYKSVRDVFKPSKSGTPNSVEAHSSRSASRAARRFARNHKKFMETAVEKPVEVLSKVVDELKGTSNRAASSHLHSNSHAVTPNPPPSASPSTHSPSNVKHAPAHVPVSVPLKPTVSIISSRPSPQPAASHSSVRTPTFVISRDAGSVASSAHHISPASTAHRSPPASTATAHHIPPASTAHHVPPPASTAHRVPPAASTAQRVPPAASTAHHIPAAGPVHRSPSVTAPTHSASVSRVGSAVPAVRSNPTVAANTRFGAPVVRSAQLQPSTLRSPSLHADTKGSRGVAKSTVKAPTAASSKQPLVPAKPNLNAVPNHAVKTKVEESLDESGWEESEETEEADEDVDNSSKPMNKRTASNKHSTTPQKKSAEANVNVKPGAIESSELLLPKSDNELLNRLYAEYRSLEALAPAFAEHSELPVVQNAATSAQSNVKPRLPTRHDSSPADRVRSSPSPTQQERVDKSNAPDKETDITDVRLASVSASQLLSKASRLLDEFRSKETQSDESDAVASELSPEFTVVPKFADDAEFESPRFAERKSPEDPHAAGHVNDNQATHSAVRLPSGGMSALETDAAAHKAKEMQELVRTAAAFFVPPRI